MQHHDTTPNIVITCHALEAGLPSTRHITTNTWKQALQQVWPLAYCVILRGPETGRPFLAARLDTDGEGIVLEGGDTPEEARGNLRKEWGHFLKHHPGEHVRRGMRPILHLLKANGARVGDRWDDLVEAVSHCHGYRQASAVLVEFIDRATPLLTEADRRRALHILETVSFTPSHALSA